MLNLGENHSGANEFLKKRPFSVAMWFIPENRCAVDKIIENTFLEHVKSSVSGMGVCTSGISNNPEPYQRWERIVHQRNQFLSKTLAMVQWEKGGTGNEFCDLQSTKIQRSKKNIESVAEALKILLNTFDVEDKESTYCIPSGLWATFDMVKANKGRDIWKTNE